MARSRHVYVIMQRGNDCPVAAFTVKHELVGWLRRAENRQRSDFALLKVYRVDDGGYPGNRTLLSVEELLAS